MAQVDLRGNIILDGRTTSGFDALGGRLAGLATAFQMIGDKVWDFERESLDIYRDYETNMLQARAALSSTYDSTAELDKIMDALGEHVQDWAQNSIFHISDFSAAVNNAAHAGWTLEQQLEGIPRAMLLAQAGNMDLSDGLEYLARALNVTGTDFKDSGVLVDQWVKASHLANLTIEDLGDSLNRMGVTAQLTDSTAELFTMLDALANTGSVGSEAGTLLRGTIMRLIAPTDKATEAMQKLQATEEEYSELAGDSKILAEANKLLKAQGFTAFDTNGQLKPLMQTYGELYDALVAIAGSEEDLLTDSQVDKILAAIFPQRQISGALSFLQAVKGGWEDLFEAIQNSEGTAQADADIMMSGLMGAEELFKSKWEEFKRKVGEELSDPMEEALGFLGGIVDSLNAMPTEVLDSLLGGLTGIAAAGTALGAARGVAWFLGMLGPWGKAAMIAAFGIGALATYLTKVAQIEFDSKFGDMAIDIEALKDSLVDFETPSDEGRKAIEEWTEDVAAAAEAYSGLAESFAQELKLDTLTNAELTPDDLTNLKKLGADMQAQVLEGISLAAKRDQVSVNALFGVTSEADYENLSAKDQALYDTLSQAFEDYYGGLEGEAYDVGLNIRNQLVAAFADGNLTPEEEAAIKAQIERYNQIMAEIADAQHAEEMAAMMNAAQRVSRESYETWMDDLDGEFAKAIEEREQYWDRQKAKIDVLHEKGLIKGYYDENLRRWVSPEEAYQQELNKVAQDRQADIDSTRSYFGQLAAEATSSALYDSDFGEPWGFLNDQLGKGNITFDESGNADFSNLDFSGVEDAAELYKQVEALYGNRAFFEKLLGIFGDYDETKAITNLLEGSGDALSIIDDAAMSQALIADRESEDRRTVVYGSTVDTLTDAGDMSIDAMKEQLIALDDVIENQKGWKNAREEVEEYLDIYQQLVDLGETDGLQNLDDLAWYVNATESGFIGEFGKAEVSPDYSIPLTDPNKLLAADEVLGMGYSFPLNAQINYDDIQSQLAGVVSGLHIPLAGATYQQQLEDQGVNVTVDGDTTELAANIEAEDGQTLMQYVDGDASDLHMTIWDEDGQLLVEDVTGDTTQLEAILNGYNGRTVTVFLKGQQLFGGAFAEGGRATIPSIFGEAGPEWAIPEEHSERTAALLNAAREASGFTWDDLISRYGGLNADENHINVNLSYAPTINATDAEGVAAALERDKARLKQLVKDAVREAMDRARLHDDVEVYA